MNFLFPTRCCVHSRMFLLRKVRDGVQISTASTTMNPNHRTGHGSLLTITFMSFRSTVLSFLIEDYASRQRSCRKGGSQEGILIIEPASIPLLIPVKFVICPCYAVCQTNRSDENLINCLLDHAHVCYGLLRVGRKGRTHSSKFTFR